MTLNDLAMAYELRQEGCCWKRIAQGLGCDWVALKSAVEGIMRHGIKRHLSGHDVQPGRRPAFSTALLQAAHRLKVDGFGWQSIASHLGVDRDALRKAYRYAINAGVAA